MTVLSNSTESSPTSIPATADSGLPGYEKPAGIPAPPSVVAVEEGSDTDEFGYKIIKPMEPAVEEPKSAPEATPPVVPAEEVKTGYETPAADDKGQEPPKADPATAGTDAEKIKKEIGDIVKELPEGIDKDKVSKFALDNKLSSDQMKAYASLVKEENTKFVADQETFKKAQRLTWYNDLKADPDFGGQKFDENIAVAGKMLGKLLPNTKKVLTERGSMLPPYLMKDLAKLEDMFNPKTSFEGGQPPVNESDDSDFLSDMYK